MRSTRTIVTAAGEERGGCRWMKRSGVTDHDERHERDLGVYSEMYESCT